MIPWMLLAVAVLIVRPPRSIRPVRAARRPSTTADLARLLSIASTAGLPLGTAIETIAPELDGPVGRAVAQVVRTSRTTGLAAALLSSDALGALGPVLARAHASGSPLAPTLESYLAAESSRRVTAALEDARTAPVKLMVPLALFLLPGFTALVVGPTLLDHVLDMTRFGT